METVSTKPRLIDFGQIGGSALGYISVAEFQNNVPFEIKRVYWTYYTPHDVVRGHHAHKTLEQIIIAANGVIRFELENTQGNKFQFTLDHPDQGLYIPPMFWRTIKFSHSGILLCLASSEFSEEDYIRDYEVFKNGLGE